MFSLAGATVDRFPTRHSEARHVDWTLDVRVTSWRRKAYSPRAVHNVRRHDVIGREGGHHPRRGLLLVSATDLPGPSRGRKGRGRLFRGTDKGADIRGCLHGFDGPRRGRAGHVRPEDDFDGGTLDDLLHGPRPHDAEPPGA